MSTDKKESLSDISTANSTKKIADLTAVLAAIAIVSAVITAGQWWEIRAGSADTSKMADSAVRQADSSLIQLGIIKNQLDEMRKQRLLMTVQTKANLQRDLIVDRTLGIRHNAKTNKTGWIVNPVWANSGTGDAINFKAWWGIAEVRDLGQKQCPSNIDFGRRFEADSDIVSRGAGLMQVGDILPILPEPIQTKLFVFGHAEYSDVISESDRNIINWCVEVAPIDQEKGVYSFINRKI